MAILAECPNCRRKQAVKNKVCKCGAELDKLKRSKKIRYPINFRIPDGKQRREFVSNSIEKAKDADGKRRGQKRENRIFDMLPDPNMTFSELSDWYLGLNSVRKLLAYERVRIGINNFNMEFGDKIIGSIQPVNLEDYQIKREKDGMAPATIDMEVGLAKTMIIKAFDNDIIDGRPLKAFRRVKKKLKKGANARKRTITINEYLRLLESSSDYFKPILITAYNTGMRSGELRQLQWSYIDAKAGFIRFPAEVVKEKKPKNIPINYYVKEVLLGAPKSLDHDFVFTNRGMPLKTADSVSYSFQKTCKRSNILYGRKDSMGATLHDIRRTVKTNMINAGVDKAHRDVILGHAFTGMDVHYIAPDEETLKEAMKKYTRWLDTQIEKASASVDHTVDQKAT